MLYFFWELPSVEPAVKPQQYRLRLQLMFSRILSMKNTLWKEVYFLTQIRYPPPFKYHSYTWYKYLYEWGYLHKKHRRLFKIAVRRILGLREGKKKVYPISPGCLIPVWLLDVHNVRSRHEKYLLLMSACLIRQLTIIPSWHTLHINYVTYHELVNLK